MWCPAKEKYEYVRSEPNGRWSHDGTHMSTTRNISDPLRADCEVPLCCEELKKKFYCWQMFYNYHM